MTAAAHDDNLDRLTLLHDDLLSEALFDLEDKAADIVSNLPTRSGKLYDLNAAIFARQELEQAITDSFLVTANDIVKSYDESVVTLIGIYQEILEDVELAPTQINAINQLKTMAFKGFEDVASTHLEVMAREVYQSTITGRTINEVTKSIRHAVNGVYISSNDDEAQALVDFISENKDKASMAAQVDKAIEQLHTKYARDRVGNNLRRYSTVYAHDSLMQFSSSANISVAQEVGVQRFRYYGESIKDSRQWCKDHVGKVYTVEEINELWSNNNWAGKSSSDGLIARGGYNCRHSWVPVVDN